MAHAPLWAALRARTIAVHVIAVGTRVGAAQRAAHVLEPWTRDGDDQAETHPAGRFRVDRMMAGLLNCEETAVIQTFFGAGRFFFAT